LPLQDGLSLYYKFHLAFSLEHCCPSTDGQAGIAQATRSPGIASPSLRRIPGLAAPTPNKVGAGAIARKEAGLIREG